MFDRTTYVDRRRRLTQMLDSGLVLLMGNEESPMNYADNTYTFRQDSSFLYFAGLDQPHLAVLIDLDSGDATLYGDDLSIDHVVWMGPQPSIRERADQSGLSHTAPFDSLPGVLAAARAQGRAIHYLPPYRSDLVIRLHQWLDIPLGEVTGRASRPLIEAVVALRSIKSEEELSEMEKAVDVSGAMHVAAIRAARPGIREARLAGIVEGIAVGSGGRLAYPVILSVNGQTLHNHYHGNLLTEGRLVLGDFGAETDRHYAGDLTRTFPVAKTFSARQREIYDIVLAAHLNVIEAMRPGYRYLDAHLLAARTIASGLKELGLMSGDVDTAVAEGAHALFFPHGLGHMIGLDVHDMEDLGEDLVGYSDTVKRSSQFGLRSLRFAKELEPGHVLTVEPGIYFIPELIDQWQSAGKFRDFIQYDKLEAYLDFGGIRIEDNVVVTAEGHRILGRPVPKTAAEVEALRE